MTDIIVYSSNFCPYCTQAKGLLKRKNVPYKEINVDFNPGKRNEMRQKANGRNSVPQIFIDGEHIGGCDDLFSLDDRGKLDLKLD